MAGYDLINWQPQITTYTNGNPAADADAWNVPGATKLDASVDAGAATLIKAGSSSFSSTPTISEINASSDLNQVLGALNRRIRQYNTLFGTSMTPLSYLAAGAKINDTDFSAINTAINTLRTTEGFASYTFPTAEIANNKRIFGYHLAHMRKALRISGTMTKIMSFGSVPTDSRMRFYQRTDNPFGTFASEFASSGWGVGYGAGKEFTDSTHKKRDRTMPSFPVPDWVGAAPASVALSVTPRTLSTALESFTAELYSSNTDDSLTTPTDGGTPFNTNNLEDSKADTLFSGGSPTSLTVSAARYFGKAGGRMSFILCTFNERTVAGSSSNGNSFLVFDSPSTMSLVIDFGT